MGEELRAGKAEASPLAERPSDDPCRFCDYARICGFDPKKQEVRLMRRLKDAEFWELAAGREETAPPAAEEAKHG